MPLNILHLSDIHFKYELDGTIHDLDNDVRNELEIDVRRVTRRSGPINAIVVTGDVAFAGKAEDYEVARKWLATLCEKIGCETAQVWVVPGNHDVDWNKITELVRRVQDAIQQTPLDQMDGIIRQLVHEDPMGADALGRPLEDYNRFSAIYGCKPTGGCLAWKDELVLNMGYTLRLVGLNSALVSNKNDDQQSRPLVVGQAQLDLPRELGYIYVSLCHHPVSWLRDGETVHSKLCKRAALQLFGHVHEQALRQVGNSLIVQAGALQPDREEDGPWRPAYNVLSLEVIQLEGEHALSVTAYPRVWCDDHCFSPDVTAGHRECRGFSLSLDAEISLGAVNPADATEALGTVAAREPAGTNIGMEQARNTVNPVRQLAYAFLTLPYSTQMRLASQLSLLEDEDAGVDCATLFERVYRRAKARNDLAALWDRVSGAQQEVSMMTNPYKSLEPEEEKASG